MNTTIIIVGIINTLVAAFVILGIRFKRISPKIAAIIMTIYSFIGASILAEGELRGTICMGSLLAISFGLPTLVFGYGLVKWISRKEESS